MVVLSIAVFEIKRWWQPAEQRNRWVCFVRVANFSGFKWHFSCSGQRQTGSWRVLRALITIHCLEEMLNRCRVYTANVWWTEPSYEVIGGQINSDRLDKNVEPPPDGMQESSEHLRPSCYNMSELLLCDQSAVWRSSQMTLMMSSTLSETHAVGLGRQAYLLAPWKC